MSFRKVMGIMIIGVVMILGVMASGLFAPDRFTDPIDAFHDAVRNGAPCAELFQLRNELDPDDLQVRQMNEQLRLIGCHSSGSTRTDL